MDDPKDGDLRLFESLEALSPGVEGKKSLWLTLSTLAEDEPALTVADYQRLTHRAEEQRGRVEKLRLQTASKALKLTP